MIVDTTSPDAIRAAAASPRLLRASTLDVDRQALARLERDGELVRIIPGIYVGALHQRHTLIEAAAWTLRHPTAVVGLLTAAVYHDLTDAFARGTWLLVPKGTSVPRSRVAPLHVVQTNARFIDPEWDGDNGIVVVDVHSAPVRLTDPDRTTIDLWRYPRRISAESALEALRRRVTATDFVLPRFARLARRLRAWTQLADVVQGLVLR